jgi:[ribosomal protein S18]-alanine N-acetyltransferase
MPNQEFQVRPAEDHDRREMALLLAAVAEERDGIASEPPIDVDAVAAKWFVDGTIVAVADGEIIGELGLESVRFGVAEIGMMVAAGWRRRGVGTALLAAAIESARAHGLHKLSLATFPHNDAAIALYRKVGFVEEGRRREHIRRANGERWDLIVMGLLFDPRPSDAYP